MLRKLVGFVLTALPGLLVALCAGASAAPTITILPVRALRPDSAVWTLLRFRPGQLFRVNITLPFRQHNDPKGSNLMIQVRGYGPPEGGGWMTKDVTFIKKQPKPAVQPLIDLAQNAVEGLPFQRARREDAAVRVIVGVLIVIAWGVVPVWLTYEMGKQLGRRWYLVFGLVLSWLGVLIVVLLRRSERGQLA